MPKGQNNWMKGKTQEATNSWKGDNAGYAAKHLWLSAHYDKGKHCEDCGIETDYLDWANVSGEYRRDREDYRALCRKCHRKLDAKPACRKGHPYSPANTQIYKGMRRCLTCYNDYWNKNRQKKKEYDKKRYEEQKDKLKNYYRLYYQANREKKIAYQRAYHMRKKPT